MRKFQKSMETMEWGKISRLLKGKGDLFYPIYFWAVLCMILIWLECIHITWSIVDLNTFLWYAGYYESGKIEWGKISRLLAWKEDLLYHFRFWAVICMISIWIGYIHIQWSVNDLKLLFLMSWLLRNSINCVG